MVFNEITITIIIIIVIFWILRKVYYSQKIKSGRIDLAGKVVVITGASSGIGEALAHKFYMAGCKVILAARRQQELERVKSNLLNLQANNSHPPEIVILDLADLNSLHEKASQILSMCNHVDILINNAGVSLRSDIMTVKTEVDVRLIYINYLGTITFTKAFLPSMIQRRQGKIVCVSSVVGKIAIPYRSSYTASKHALQAFCDCLRAEMAAYNIQVLVSSPGYVATDVSRNALTGYGTAHGVMDPETAAGETPEHCAEGILLALLKGDPEITPFQYKLVQWIRVTFPSLYFSIMEKRARKLAQRYRNPQYL